jgi:hypothetical protein
MNTHFDLRVMDIYGYFHGSGRATAVHWSWRTGRRLGTSEPWSFPGIGETAGCELASGRHMQPFAAALTMLLSFATLAAGQERAPRLVLEREFVLRQGVCRSLAWSYDGNHIASGGEARDVQVIDAMTGEVVRELLDHGRQVPNLAFTPDDARLLIGAPDQPAFAVDCTTGRVVGDMVHAPRLVLPGWVQEAAAGAPAAARRSTIATVQSWRCCRSHRRPVVAGSRSRRRRGRSGAAASSFSGRSMRCAPARRAWSVSGACRGIRLATRSSRRRECRRPMARGPAHSL